LQRQYLITFRWYMSFKIP